MTSTLSPVAIQTYITSHADGGFIAGVPSMWASKGSVVFGYGEIELVGDERDGVRPSLKMEVVKMLRGGASPEFICRRKDGQLVGVIAAQHRKKGG